MFKNAVGLIAGVLLWSSSLVAQWEIVAPELTGPAISFYGVFGCMEYKDGVLWAGSISIHKSLDTGKTWVPASDTLGEVRSLRFFDKNIGVACIGASGVYKTTDQGESWEWILDIGYSNAVCFGRTPDDIMVTFHDGGGVAITHNGGRTWTMKPLPGFTTDAISAKGGRTMVIVGGTQATIYMSNDFGGSFTDMMGGFDHDTWSIAADSCDPRRFYAVNEEALSFTNGLSEIFVTSDEGRSWRSTFVEPSGLSGAIVTGPNTVYATTVSHGVVRSTDRGMTWTNIGGPGCTFDSRCLTVINDNIVFALDSAGSIWRTMNSGGDSVTLGSPGSMKLSMDRPFDDETPYVCELPIGRSITLDPACGARIRSIRLAGERSDAFRILDYPERPQPGDSIWLSFNIDSAGEYNAALEVELASGEVMRVPLRGVALAPRPVALSDEPQFFRNDTIGGVTTIPIHLSDVSTPSAEFVIHYDTVSLVYEGTFDAGGNDLTERASSSPGRAIVRVHTTGDDPVAPIAFTRFAFYPVRDSCVTITIDSLRFHDESGNCVIATGVPAQSTICTDIGCGTFLLSKFTRYGLMPDLRLHPNPASSTIQLSTSRDIGHTELEIIDMKGTLISRRSATITASRPAELDLEQLLQGTYYLRVTTMHASRTLRFVKQ